MQLKCTVAARERILAKELDENGAVKKNENGRTIWGFTGYKPKPFHFFVKIFKSGKWDKIASDLTRNTCIEIPNNKKQIYIARIHQTGGDTHRYRIFLKEVLMIYCRPYLNGLPRWSQRVLNKESANIII